MRLQEILQQQGYVVLDGGLATELEGLGESLNDPLWSAKVLLSAPDKIARVHTAYFEAGADVATTASYQATFAGLATRGLSRQQAEMVLRQTVSVAVEARDRFWSEEENRAKRMRPLVAASIGPYGAFLHDGSEYRGHYGVSRAVLRAFHRERLQVLADSGADLLACETVPSLVEAEVLVELLSECELRAWVSFSCKDGKHISDGTRFADAVRAVESSAVAAVGLNCTAPRFVDSLLEEARAVTDKPLVAYPNSGELFEAATSAWRSTSEVGMIERAAFGWRERGALLIGGCCRTTPETIRGIRRVLRGGLADGGSN
jgi:homocysteine S-methyltransferase